MFPVFCRLKDSDGLLRSAFTKASRISMFWISAAALGLTLFAPDIVRYVLTERWHGAELFLRAQGIALFFGATISGWESLLKARNRTRVIFQMSVFFGICFVAIFIPAVALWGRVGAAGAVVVISAIILATRVLVLSRLGLGISIVEIGWRATLSGAAAVAAVFAFSGFAQSSSLAILAARVALYLFVYACTLLTLELNLLREIVPLLLPQGVPPVAEAVERG
jgi:O-antigen/teichoic acid export membrane protein